MPRVSVRTEGREAFETAVGPLFAEYRHDTHEYRRERAHRIAEVARMLAPRLVHVDPRFYPGELADSIRVRDDALESEVTVGVRWAGYQEFGTSHNNPRPYLRPAVAYVIGSSR
jgi:hypothetical protein